MISGTKYVVRALVLAGLLLSVVATGSSFAVTHVISSLPYSCYTPYDTLTLSGNLSAATRAITVDASAHDILIDGGGDTIFFNTAQANGVMGILVNPGDNVTIQNLTLIQYSSIGDTCQGFRIGRGDALKLIDCNVHVKGADSRNVYCQGTREFEIRGGNYTSFANEFDSREYNLAACLLLNDMSPPVHDEPYDYMYWVHGITIDSCPHGGIVADGLVWIDSNFVRVDAHNDRYSYPSGDMFHTSANAYAIAIDFLRKGSRAIGNTIRSGTNHEGGRGMMIGRASSGSTQRGFEVAHNDIRVWRGPEDSYGDAIFTVGIRMRSYSIGDSGKVHHNYIKAEADNNPNTAYKGKSAFGIFCSGPGNGNQIYNNTIEVIADTNGYYANRLADAGIYGLLIEKNTGDVGNMSYNNHIISNGVPFNFGAMNAPLFGSGNNWTSINDTIEYILPAFENQYGITAPVGVGYSGYPALNNRLRDMVFLGDNTILPTGSGTLEITRQRTLDVLVMGRNDTAVANANVTIRNTQSQVVYSGTTDGYGRCTAVLDFEFNRWNGGGTTVYTPFSIDVSMGGDNSSLTLPVDFSTTAQVLVLANTDGHGDVDPVFDNTPPAQINVHSAVPGPNLGSIMLTWTSTGDDGTVGTATYDSIRFSSEPISELNWPWATRVSRSEFPLPAGVVDSFEISHPGMEHGRYYYLGIKAYDDAGNASPLATAESYATGIVTPTVASDTVLVDTAASRVTVYAAAVPTYLNLYYNFEVSYTSNFGSPLASQDTNPGAYAEATFDLDPAYDSIFVRCRAIADDASHASWWSAARVLNLTSGFTNSPPMAPTPYTPLPNDTMSTTTPLLIVNNGEDSDGDPLTYEFEIYDDSTNALVRAAGPINEGASRTQWTVPASLLQDGQRYRWRARCFDGADFSAWMTPITFTVIILGTGGGTQSPAPVEVFAYPNPANCREGDHVTFILPATPVDLTIMTVTGDIVKVFEGVSNEMDWDGTNQQNEFVAPGVYPWFISGNQGKGKLILK